MLILNQLISQIYSFLFKYKTEVLRLLWLTLKMYFYAISFIYSCFIQIRFKKLGLYTIDELN